MNQPSSKRFREVYHALFIAIMTFFMVLIPMMPSLKAKAAPQIIKKIYIYDFNPQVHDEMGYQQARSALVSTCTVADDAPYVTDVSNSSINQSGLSWDTKLKSGSATFGLRLFALPKGNEVPNPDYDFDRDHLDEIEVYINNEKRSDVTVKNYNEWWRSVTVNIPITVSHYTGTKYSVTFNSNGGSSVATQYVAPNCYLMEPEVPTYQGKVFKGWYKDSALTTQFFFDSGKITQNTVLYAKWEKAVVTEYIKRIDFNNFYPKLDNGMTGTQGVASLQETYTHPDGAPYQMDLSNSSLIQDNTNMQSLTLKQGNAIYSARIFARPFGNRVQNPDYDFDRDHLDEIEVYINGVKRSDVTVVDYNEYWRCVSVRIPVTVEKAKDPITGTLSITGTVQSGETLTAKVTNSNTSSFNYVWMRNNSVISGETSSTYTLASYDVGKKITCTVTDATSTYNGQLQATTTEYVLKAKGPDAPTGLTPITPSKKGASDGKITGVDTNMEYSTKSDFSADVNSCTSNTITGLEAGTYYVRVKANSSTFEGEAAKVIVKDGPEVHTHGGSNLITHPAIAATCADPGSDLYYECSCGKYFSDSTCKTEIQKNSWIIKAKGHDWSAPTYTWSSDNSQCTAVKVCKNDKNHYIKETENTSYKVTKQPTETTTGTGVYTVTFTKSDFTTQTKTVTIAKLSHKHKPQHHGAVAATCTTAGNSEYYSCECGKYFSDYACTTEINKDSWVINAKGHNYGAPTYTWSADNKSVTATKVCKNDSSHVVTQKVNTTYKVITQPTETKEGVGQYTATFTTEGFETQTKTVTISKTTHKHSGSNVTYHAAMAATCTTAGNSAYYSCSCGKYFSDKECTKEINKNSWIIKAKGHNYGDATYTWSSDNKTVTGTKVCKNDKSHKLTDKVNTTYVVLQEPTETTEGKGQYTATFTKNGFTTQYKEVTIAKVGHKHSGSNVTYHAAVAATCEKAGNSAYYSCSCGKYFSDKECTKEINKNSWIIKAKGHNYGAPTYTWSSDNKTVTAKKVCKNDSSHVVTQKVNTTYKVVTQPTETKEGVGQYIATFTTEGFETQTKSVTISKTTHKHSGSNVTYHAAVAATCEKAGNSAYYSCSCGKYFSDKECTKEIKKNSWIIKAKGHNYGDATYTWSSDNKTVTGTKVCKNDKSHKVKEKVNTTYTVILAPTEKAEGKGRYTATFTQSGFTTQYKEVTIAKVGHKHSGNNVTYHAAVAATCEKAGNSAYYSCSCGKYFSDKACTKEIKKNSWVIKAKGHTYGEATYAWSSDNKTVTATKVCKNDKSHSVKEKATTTYKVIKEATEKATGVGRYTATFKTEGFKNQTKDVTIPKLIPADKDVTKKFSDVKAGEWYVKAIQFVYDKKYMSGVSENKFGTNTSITREQFVTVLYNIEGQPSVKYRKQFKDVADKQYYSKAVIWAYDNKITNGVSAKVFGTGNNISREQLATMLYNYSQYKKLKGVSKNKDLTTFPDYKKISSWAKEGMTWAVSNGVVNGKASNGKTYLNPAGIANRAECAQMIKNLFDNVIKK